jgi:NhaA family Na+:H+ antiporter
MTDEVQQYAVIQLEEVCEHVQAPLQKLEHLLHRWVSFLIMPVFALANAGVLLSLQSLAGETLPMGLGIIMGLVLGKPIGLLGSAWLAIRTGLVSLPQDVRWRHMIGAAFLAGIGFTMSLFIAALAFDDELLAAAKLGILMASILAGGIGFILLSRKPANHV